MPTWLAPESRVFVPTIMFLHVLPCSRAEPDSLRDNPLVFRDSQRRRKVRQFAPVIVA